jgi:hypothetical protein
LRLWTFHPQYLDRSGLLAVWREALLAQKVLSGATHGYRHHPQLRRFVECGQPLLAIGSYLNGLFQEAGRRGYRFAFDKIIFPHNAILIDETDGQLLYEWQHLKRKLQQRSKAKYDQIADIKIPQPHPLFNIISGPVKPWEKTVK